MSSTDTTGDAGPSSAETSCVGELSLTKWTHATPTFRALNHRFAVRSTHGGIGRFVEEMCKSFCVADQGPFTWYSIVHGLPGDAPHALYVNEDRMVHGPDASDVVSYLIWHINRQAIRSSHDRVLLHAAAASLEGFGVLLPGAMESGKTTLVAGLTMSGFQYLTDEAAAIDPETLSLHPYPKPLSVDPGSWTVLADLAPRLDGSTAAYFDKQWQVPPTAIYPEAVSGPVQATVVVFPNYERGADTDVAPMPKSEALLVMLEQTFQFHAAGPRNLEVLARLLEDVTCYRMISGDLDEACQAVTHLVHACRPVPTSGTDSR